MVHSSHQEKRRRQKLSINAIEMFTPKPTSSPKMYEFGCASSAIVCPIIKVSKHKTLKPEIVQRVDFDIFGTRVILGVLPAGCLPR